jgi:hypothetical protein
MDAAAHLQTLLAPIGLGLRIATGGIGSGRVSEHSKPKPKLKIRTRPEHQFGWKSIPETKSRKSLKPDGLSKNKNIRANQQQQQYIT